ncbi:MAG: STAS/SEC14 domain-containing protein [Methyloceanibacter sp.]|jgi:hypothetical protein|uniref:STAS/SEC14 domain-containing protein n=1 Tax=Methyloceanibacter sp. TaxID=1965321 RepID=UPI003C4A58F3
MLKHELQLDKGVLIVRPEGPLSAQDFSALTTDTDAYITAHGALKGLMICAKAFPAWDNIDAAISHFKFVRDHHRLIAKVAVVTDSEVLSLLPVFASHFVKANVKHFKGNEEAKALAWIAA